MVPLLPRSLAAALRGRGAVLFTGAGFSCDARDRGGALLPTSNQLRRELWRLCFPDEEPDGSTLADLFHHAMKQRPAEVERLLARRLHVDPASLREHHRLWFALPWRRVYTLNVDDLEAAVARRFGLPIRSVSALDDGRARGGGLEVVHLNGVVDRGPAGVTFSTIQYGERLARRCRHYERLVKELRARSFVFVGTRLGEAPLWQHVELFHARGRRRPRSFLVTERLDRARQSVLAELGIEWIPMTARAFARDVLARVPIEEAMRRWEKKP